MSQNSGHEQHHVTPFSTYMNVFIALVVLTILTVIFHVMHMGALAAPIAFVIATSKAYLVMAYFMHLKHDTPMNRTIFGVAFFFVGLLFFIAILDVLTRTKVLNTL
jgi:cytochrome c oxidase subunit 4